MIDVQKQIEVEGLENHFREISSRAKLFEKEARLEELTREQESPDFWNDQDKVKTVGQELARLRNFIEDFSKVQQSFRDLNGIAALLNEADDDQLSQEYDPIVESVKSQIEAIEVKTFLSGRYDSNDAVLSIHAGQGGAEASDWASMISRMYMRYFERKSWKFELVDESRVEEGLKSATYIVHGDYAYGLLKHDSGAHRLVRLSPFNADNLRQTSFVGVEVLPLIPEDDKEMEIKADDLEWQFTRAGGHGGQNVNKVNSAVILKHIPSGIIVECRQERYQEQNKKTALSILKSKLAVIEEEKRANEISQVKGAHKIAGWGNQIRNYVLHPYHLVKDTRTKIETSDTQAVLDGDLDLFTQSNVRML